ncbi:hypothetical protein LPJ53_003147 [Coemansia erecta]|uniref:Dopey N-terminal domain-containing protein n=1 Tax=Coemansia erecta TaxID=147472 RepID=A0A9W7XZU7_9FUNG|nr:hypothetical protein LPJ53_003147 [Coemansia erecta]
MSRNKGRTTHSDRAPSDAGGNSAESLHAGHAGFETDLSTPRRRRLSDRAKEYQSEPKYQKYVQLVERNLQSFEYVNEWADVTAFLTKLGKSFELYAQYPVIPHKETVAKRLAQCLNPALPTGVHQKVLGIYEQIFNQIGSQQMALDLALYAYGLFPFMRHASVKTKGQLLDIFEQYFVPLGPRLRACMKGLAMGVLAGLDEGSADVVARVMHVLDRLRDAVDAAFFHQTMFLIMITHPRQRESALKYLAQRLPVLATAADLAAACGDEASLLARGLAAALADAKTLVLRAALDVLLTRLPLHARVLDAADLAMVAERAAAVVLKKDMSLNRRLYTWLLGPSEAEAEQAAYFAQHAQGPLAEALLGAVGAAAGDGERQQTAVRVLVGLADKPLIAQPVLDALLVPLLRLLMAEGAVPVRLASVSRMLVEMLDPLFVWARVLTQLADAAAREPLDALDVARALRLLLFFVQTFELDDEASLHVHVPMAMLAVLAMLERLLRQAAAAAADDGGGDRVGALAAGFARLAVELFARIPKAAFAAEDEGAGAGVAAVDVGGLAATTRAFYRLHGAPAADDAAAVEQAAAAVVRGPGLLHAAIQLAKRAGAHLARRLARPAAASAAAAAALEDTGYVLQTAAAYAQDLVGRADLARSEGASDGWALALVAVAQGGGSGFAAQRVALDTLLAFVERGLLGRHVLRADGRLAAVVGRLWARLDAAHTGWHVPATRLLWRLRRLVDAEQVERLLAGKLTAAAAAGGQGGQAYARELARYAALWRSLRGLRLLETADAPLAFSRLLLLVLDDVDVPLVRWAGGEEDEAAAALGRGALAQAWVDAAADMWPAVAAPLALLLLRSVGGGGGGGEPWRREYSAVLAVGHASQCFELTRPVDHRRAAYYADTLLRYLRRGGVVGSMQGGDEKEGLDRQVQHAWLAWASALPADSWLQLVVSAGVEVAVTGGGGGGATGACEELRVRAAGLAAFGAAQGAWAVAYLAALQARVADALLFAVLHKRASVQAALLDLLCALVQARVQGGAGHEPTAGILCAPALFAKMVLAALTVQRGVAPLRRWVLALRACLPAVQRLVDAPLDSVDVLQALALPCLRALLLLLAQCAGGKGDQDGGGGGGGGLRQHMAAVFAVPVDAAKEEGGEDGEDEIVGVDGVAVLLDALDILLALCLSNAERLAPLAGGGGGGGGSGGADELKRPSSRASSVGSTQSAGAGAIQRLVSGLFGHDTAAATQAAEAEEEEEGEDGDGPVAAAPDAGLDLVAVLAVLRDVAQAFGRPADAPAPEEDQGLARLLGALGVRDAQPAAAAAAGDAGPLDGGDAGVVQMHVGRILAHAAGAQPAEVAEAAVALWLRDNPQWLWRLDAQPPPSRRQQHRQHRQHALARSRRRTSSVSSALTTASSQPDASAEDADADEEEKEEPLWDWRAARLLEQLHVPGCSAEAQLAALLGSVRLRLLDQGSGAGGSGGASVSAGVRFSAVGDRALLRFVELSARHRLAAPVRLAPDVLALLRLLAEHAVARPLLPFALRAATELCSRLAAAGTSSGSSSNSRRSGSGSSVVGGGAVYSHELCVLYARLVDTCVQAAGRAPVQADDQTSDHVLDVLAGTVLPQLAHLLPDHELQSAVGTALVQHAVAPALRAHMTGGLSAPAHLATSRTRHFAHVLRLLAALTHHAALLRLWARDAWDFLADAKFFAPPTMGRETAPLWRLIVRTLLGAEKERFADALARVQSAASQAALFANREAEARGRALALRRLSFCLWAAPVNQHVSVLPTIQERLVDVLKSETHARVQAEVFLCLRVLLCRVSAAHMSSFWPMLLTELMRLCTRQLAAGAGQQTGDQADLFLAACKFLDLLMVLGTEDFLVHQWIFITDTVDALYASRSTAAALLDQLSSRLLSTSSSAAAAAAAAAAGRRGREQDGEEEDPSNLAFRHLPAHVLSELDQALPPPSDGRLLPPDRLVQVVGARPLKRPIIRLRHIASTRDLDTFVHSASLLTYQAAYLMADPDIPFIDELLQNDLMYLDFEHVEVGEPVSPRDAAGAAVSALLPGDF